MSFTLPDLPYAYEALEPYIDAETMRVHYNKHHAGYVSKLNDALRGTPQEGESFTALMRQISILPQSVRNTGGGHYNHSLFWTILAPDGGGSPGVELRPAINTHFGSFENFRQDFEEVAIGHFGSGWVWLLIDNEQNLQITATPNQDNPLMDVDTVPVRGIPILGLDVWEHAYYLRYQNRRAEYVKAFWSVVNWYEVEERYRRVIDENMDF